MSIHGSISLMLFKLLRTEKGDFLGPFKKSVKRCSLAGVFAFYSEYMICTNIPYNRAEYVPYNRAEYVAKLSYPNI